MATLRRFRYDTNSVLAFAEYGNPAGFPILVQHGMIASIKDGAIFQRLIDLGTRVICMARPGYGESSPIEMKNISEWGLIVSTLVDHLKLTQFDVLGISSGAPYSYSIGYQMPEQTRNIFILSGIPALYDPQILAHWPYPVTRNASIAEMQKLAHEIFFPSITPEDLENEDVQDSMKNDCFGIAQDLRIRCMDWGFTCAKVRPRVIMRHSRSDESFAAAEVTSKLLPNCRFEIRENDPHFSQAVLDDFIQTVMAPHYR